MIDYFQHIFMINNLRKIHRISKFFIEYFSTFFHMEYV